MSVCRQFNVITLMWRDCEPCYEQIEALGAGEKINLMCDNIVYGRYVLIKLNFNEILTLCEVRVYG